MRRSIVIALLTYLLTAMPTYAAPDAQVWPIWERSNEASKTSLAHTAWSHFLATYVKHDSSGINKVAYSEVTSADRQSLQRYIGELTALDPRTLQRDEQLAYWINLYNALTVEVVLRHPNKGSILRMGTGLLHIGPWDEELVMIAGEELTLNDIEHRILRPIFQDRRIHYAINCASLGCPNLITEAYTSATTERLLNASEHAFINHRRGVEFDGRGRLRLSKIFTWYGDDFAADTPALLAYLSEHHDTLAEQLAAYDGKVRYQYDWNLNAAK
ncbi:MAG: DUF547 domain-containing protein [Pseudomonadota bacterium]